MKSFKSLRLSQLGYPAFFWAAFFGMIPLLTVFLIGFQKRGLYGGIEWVWTLDSYLEVFQPVNLVIFLRTLGLAGLTTILCLGLGFPVAWTLATLPARARAIGLFLVSLPFLISLIIKIYAIRLFMGFDGPFISLLNLLGFSIDPFAFSQNIYLVLFGMVITYLPFMVLPLFSAFEKFDFSLLEANADLGGSQWTGMTRILIPSLRQALLQSSLLVMIPAMGEIVIPDLLGGAKTMLVGNLITEQYLKSRDWPYGSALSASFLFVLMILVSSLTWMQRKKATR